MKTVALASATSDAHHCVLNTSKTHQIIIDGVSVF